MKKVLLLGILFVLLIVAACQSGQPGETTPTPNGASAPAPDVETVSSSPQTPPVVPVEAPPAASSETEAAPAVAAPTAEPITVEDLLIRDYVRLYENYCGGVAFEKTANLPAETLSRYLLGWLIENDATDPYAVYNGSNVDYYSVSPQEALAFYDVFWDNGSWSGERTSPTAALTDELRYDASAPKPTAPEIRLAHYERDVNGGYTLTVQRFMNGNEWLPAEYTFAPVTVDTVPPMLEGKTAVGGTLYRFVSMRNLPLPARETAGESILIRTTGDLLALAELVNAGDPTYQNNTYRLEANLDLAGVAFPPIGSYTTDDPRDPAPDGFCTAFDGRGHTITNLTIAQNAGSTGLFARVGANGFVTNVTLENCVISSATPPEGKSFPTGGIAGELIGGAISRSAVSGTISGVRDVGGVIGLADGNANVQECRSDASVSGNQRVGGLVGNAITGRLIECTAVGRVDGAALDHTAPDRIGGFVGLNKNATIDRGIVSARIRANTARTTVGSFAGINTGTLVGCFYNTDFSKNRTPIGSEEIGVSKTIFPRELIGMTQKELEAMDAFA